MEIEEFVDLILKKRNLRYLSREFVVYVFNNFLKEHEQEFIRNYDPKKGGKEKFREIVKKVRKILHEIFEVYYPRKIEEIENFLDNPEKILEFSISTRERLNYYKKIYQEILDSNEVVILDIACGLNPFSATYIKGKLKFYYCFDIVPLLTRIINEFFKRNRISGKCFVFNFFEIVEEYDVLKKIIDQKVDYVFLWKTVPLIEKYKPGYTLKVLNTLDSEYIVISYSRKSLGLGRWMGRAWIGWTNRLSEKAGWKVVKTFETKNEIFIKLKNEKPT